MSPHKFTSNYFVPYIWDTNKEEGETIKVLEEFNKFQITINNYSNNHCKEIITWRKKVVEWLLITAKKLALKNETVYRAIHINDIYISKMKYKITDIEEIMFSAVVCLNIACKFEEINCNYLLFLKENLLDQSYSKEKFIQKETEILKILNFKINIPNFYTFNNIFVQLFITKIAEQPKISKLISYFIYINDIITKYFATMKECIFTTPINSGLICFKTSILILSYVEAINNIEINETVSSIFGSIFNEDFLKRCDMVAFNLFTHFVNTNKIKQIKS
jgi:hypothetical protein